MSNVYRSCMHRDQNAFVIYDHSTCIYYNDCTFMCPSHSAFMTMMSVHVCTVIKIHACTMVIVHAFTMFIVCDVKAGLVVLLWCASARFLRSLDRLKMDWYVVLLCHSVCVQLPNLSPSYHLFCAWRQGQFP